MDRSSLDIAALARLWPNRAHESNWLKGVLCAVGLHRWHPLEVSDGADSKIHCIFCRWCPMVKISDVGAKTTEESH